MADVSVDATVSTATARGCRALVFTTADIGYVFYIDGDGIFGYAKTTDGGATWGAQVDVDSFATTTVIAFDVWFDQWTPGDSGTKIHCWWFDVTNDDIFYRQLDTSTDSLSPASTGVVASLSSAVAGRGAFISGTKTRSGRLFCAFDIDAGAERGLFRSTDGGTFWGANLSTTFVEATLDTCKLFPASGTGDNNDCWALYYDASATALTIKLWDSSAASEVESATIQTHTDGATDLTGQFGYDGTIRHSDGHLLVAAVSLRDNASSVHQIFDVTSTSVITTKTNITTNIDDHYYPQIFLHQASDTIYVAYNGKRDGSEVLDTTTKVYYTSSTDGGTTWTAGDTAYMEGAAGVVQQVWTPVTGPRFYALWRVAGTLLGNKVNSVVPAAGPSSQGVTGVTLTSAIQVRVPSVAVGAVTVTGAIQATTAQTHGPGVANVADDQSVTAVTLPAASVVSVPTVAVGAVTLTGAHRASAPQLFACTVTTGAVALTGATCAATSLVRVPTIAVGAVTLTGATIAAASVARVPTVTTGVVTVTGATVTTTGLVRVPVIAPGTVTVTTAALVATSQPFTPLVSQAGVTAIGGATLTTGAQVRVPTVSAGPVVLTSATCPSTRQLFAPSLEGALVITGATLSAASQVQAPTLSAGAVTLTAATCASTLQLSAPALIGVVVVTGPTLGSSVVTWAPAVSVAIPPVGAQVSIAFTDTGLTAPIALVALGMTPALDVVACGLRQLSDIEAAGMAPASTIEGLELRPVTGVTDAGLVLVDEGS